MNENVELFVNYIELVFMVFAVVYLVCIVGIIRGFERITKR